MTGDSYYVLVDRDLVEQLERDPATGGRVLHHCSSAHVVFMPNEANPSLPSEILWTQRGPRVDHD